MKECVNWFINYITIFAKSGMFDLLCVKSMIDSVTRSCLFAGFVYMYIVYNFEPKIVVL